MKTIMNSSQVCHAWAHQSQPGARNAKRSLYFDGDTIYSYGHHFPIARHIQNKRGDSAILFTTRSYSVTTSGHLSAVSRAIPHGATIFRVEDVRTEVSAEMLRKKEQEAVEAVAKSRRARKNGSWYLQDAQNLLDEAEAMKKFFGLRNKIKKMSDLGIAADAVNEAKKAEAAREKEAAKQRLVLLAEDIESWKAGNLNGLPYLPFAYGRIKGGELETSRGATVPLDHVARVAPLVRSIIAEGREFRANGHKIPLGVYAVDRIDEDGTLTAGCHKFEKMEVLRILNLVTAHVPQ